VAGVELLLDFSVELDVLVSLVLELVPDSLDSLFDDDPLVALVDFLPDSRLSVR
jgi:hypothetical protein